MLDVDGTPVGCNAASHAVHGFCCNCPGHLMAAELVAWRTWASEQVPEVRRAVIAQWTATAERYWEPPTSHPRVRE